MTEEKKERRPPKRLGRGLSALLGDSDFPAEGQPTEPSPGERVIDLPLERLEPNPYQPRREYDQEALAALSASISEHGVLQPLVVRPVEQGYQLIAGERRLRASQMAGLTTVPVVVRRATDQQALLLALLENLQRQDLNPLEEARAFLRLTDEFGLGQEEVASAVGKDRTTVTNALRLLKLPVTVQQDLAAGRLSAGHARALLPLADRKPLLRQARDEVVKKGLTVRAAEALVKRLAQPEAAPPPPPDQDQAYIASLAEQLQRRLGARVRIRRRGKKGRISIEFASDGELERLLDLLQGRG
jgi:ParB family chromosome partitioning protein